MKHEWRKHEKAFYVPKSEPVEVTVPEQKFYTLSGKGNPNSPEFAEKIAALYAVSYGIRMLPKKGIVPSGYFEYTVYPLEGIWSFAEHSASTRGAFRKEDFVYKIMIRQPDFVTEELALLNIETVSQKKPNLNNTKIQFEKITDGRSIQLMHTGPYDNEPESFVKIATYCQKNNLKRKSMAHREIYLSDARKVAPEKLKTVLRVQVE